ncbi:MAG: DUF1802 family protein [Verrucomicrobiales bacterium]|nr:DUF1802 family protein [Verrucomicrobiales bacterium]
MSGELMNVAFKEWSIICDTLGSGKQSLILRKGGIHEGNQGFQFEHEKFALFPTRFHEQEERVRIDSGKSATPKTEYQIGEIVPIQYWARIDSIWNLSQWKSIEALNEYHVWDKQIILDRYNWGKEKDDQPSINAALIRVFRFEDILKIPYEKRYRGCRSWVNLPMFTEEQEIGSAAVLNDFEFGKLKKKIVNILDKHNELKT